MISSAANRKKFIDSAKAFIKNFNLDGIDVDMEYPSAIERSAPSTDTPNLTALFKEMRASMGSDAIISVAAPAGYWFLKGFEIDKIMQDISYINMMSYDYHGPWDTAVPGEDSTAKPHTSVKDIEDSVKLYTRAGVDLSKVNLGLAWYGRTYNVGSCKGMGCKMTGGGAPGSCTGESGVVSQLEVWNDNPKPTLDTNSQTYWYNKGNDFITYDDQTTWAYKTDYAAKHCFGGTFVWSLDQVRPSTKPPPPPPVDVDCGGITLDSSTINDCNVLSPFPPSFKRC
ncbi:glycoside hydrolase [Pluteus cervinus]|uniref:Glycoside hydrolase n=1 Tax=Pluteus cervinus TaxID=181527 RepID=A0ACD3AUG5_9AGAR|nr:glycoside hydrolase [Pluteus cervinus]